MDNQHKMITGYRDLSLDEINAMNALKQSGVALGEQIDLIAKLPGVDQRWLSIGRTQLQQGFMAAIRAIAQPTTF